MSKAKALALLAGALGIGAGGYAVGGAMNRGVVPPDESPTNANNPPGSDADPNNTSTGRPIERGETPPLPDPGRSIEGAGEVRVVVEPPDELTTNQTDPGVQSLLKLVGKSMDPRYQAIVGDQNLRRQKELNQQTQQLSLEKQVQMDKRLIEQENIRAWRDTYKAQVEANAKLALGTASTIALAMTPNANFQQQITNAMNSAMGAGKTAGN